MSTNTMKQVYLLAQEHCGLKIGDCVKITRKATSLEGGWCNTWDRYNQECVGKTGKIKMFENYGILVDVQIAENVTYALAFPYFVLEKVEKHKHHFKPFDKVLVRDTNNQEWQCNFFSHKNENSVHCTSLSWLQCIPYEGNEHLVGTKDMPDE